jgi:hypothetical protein
MKIKLCCAMLLLFMLVGACFSQTPKPVLEGAEVANEVSADFLLPAKDQSHIGFGGQLTASHFFNDYIGAQLQGDYLKTNEYGLHDAGVRIGPIVHFWNQRSIQPYVRVLVGYAEAKSSYLKPAGSYQGSGSILGGGGIEVPLSGGWLVKGGADLQNDWGNHTRAGRLLFGISYRFNARPDRR